MQESLVRILAADGEISTVQKRSRVLVSGSQRPGRRLYDVLRQVRSLPNIPTSPLSDRRRDHRRQLMRRGNLSGENDRLYPYRPKEAVIPTAGGRLFVDRRNRSPEQSGTQKRRKGKMG